MNTKTNARPIFLLLATVLPLVATCDDDDGASPDAGLPADAAPIDAALPVDTATPDMAVIPDAVGDMGLGDAGDALAMAKDPATAEKVAVDRFSDQAAMLMRRSAAATLPGPNQAINFDVAPFVTQGLGPAGQKVKYYNFDVQSTTPAPIYVFFQAGASMPIPGQLNVVDVIPGDPGYNDFWLVHKVTVPAGYVANTVTSHAELVATGWPIEATTTLVNCPVVPEGSTATLRLGGGSSALVTGWYKGKTVRYFSFEEKALTGPAVPTSPIYVTFTINPNLPGGGPASGFVTEPGTMSTHNVVATLPTDAAYSPLWLVNVYDNAAFASVSNLSTATAAPQLAAGVATVNCPIVEVQ